MVLHYPSCFSVATSDAFIVVVVASNTLDAAVDAPSIVVFAAALSGVSVITGADTGTPSDTVYALLLLPMPWLVCSLSLPKLDGPFVVTVADADTPSATTDKFFVVASDVSGVSSSPSKLASAFVFSVAAAAMLSTAADAPSVVVVAAVEAGWCICCSRRS